MDSRLAVCTSLTVCCVAQVVDSVIMCCCCVLQYVVSLFTRDVMNLSTFSVLESTKDLTQT